MLFSRDTSPEARRILIELLRKQTPAEKLAMVDDLVAAARELVMSGLRLDHPGASPEELDTLYWRLALGPEVAGRALEARCARATHASLRGTDVRRPRR